MIIIGYQGIGKSTLAGHNSVIDLESGNFWNDGKRIDDWYIIDIKWCGEIVVYLLWFFGFSTYRCAADGEGNYYD